MLLLAIATSIDALAVGISFAFLQVSILPAVCLIAATTFVISFAAVFLGDRIGGKLGKYAEIAGGIILILIGLKILIEHLFGQAERSCRIAVLARGSFSCIHFSM